MEDVKIQTAEILLKNEMNDILKELNEHKTKCDDLIERVTESIAEIKEENINDVVDNLTDALKERLDELETKEDVPVETEIKEEAKMNSDLIEPLEPIAFSDEVLENKKGHDFSTVMFHSLPIDVKMRQLLYDQIMEEYERVKKLPNSDKKYYNGKLIL